MYLLNRYRGRVRLFVNLMRLQLSVFVGYAGLFVSMQIALSVYYMLICILVLEFVKYYIVCKTCGCSLYEPSPRLGCPKITQDGSCTKCGTSYLAE